MNVAARLMIFLVAAVIFTGIRMNADEAAAVPPAAPSNGPAATVSISLTNRALVLISRLRGVAPAQVKIRGADGRRNGAFEIEIADAKDAAGEAEQLSKELGAMAAVILEQASNDGLIRTNWTFKSGTVQRLTAPVGKSGLRPGSRRMYVWPESTVKGPTVPSKLRVRDQLN